MSQAIVNESARSAGKSSDACALSTAGNRANRCARAGATTNDRGRVSE